MYYNNCLILNCEILKHTLNSLNGIVQILVKSNPGIKFCTYTTTNPIVFVVTKSSSSDSAALNANTQCFKSRPVKIWVGRIHIGPLLSVSAPFLQFRQLHYNKCLGTHFNLIPIPFPQRKWRFGRKWFK